MGAALGKTYLLALSRTELQKLNLDRLIIVCFNTVKETTIPRFDYAYRFTGVVSWIAKSH